VIRPPNVTAPAFDAFLAESAAAVGAAWVKIHDEDVHPYGRVMVPFEDDVHMPSAAVCPQSLDEVRAVVAAAQAHSVPLWPTSTGRNMGYGSSAVAVRGTVVLDMRRMNRITDFDPELGTVVVEPGVTYQALHDFLEAGGHDFWIDFPGPGPLVSPMGNTLERGHGMTPYGDHFANSCGYEILLADGTLFRTGLGGISNTTSWQANRHGIGPSLDGIFTQSNFGIVTKMGLWLMPAPPAHKTVLAHWPNRDDIVKLVDVIRSLRVDGTIANEGVLGNATIFLAAAKRRSAVFAGSGALPPDLALTEMRAVGLGAWNYVFSLYGRPDRVESDWLAAQRRLEDSGATLIPDVRDGTQINELTLKSFALFNWVGGNGLAWFAPVAPARGRDVKRQFDLAESILSKYDLDFMTGSQFGTREVLNVIPLIYDRRTPGRIDQVRVCFNELIDAFGRAGYGFYRTGIGFMDRVAALQGTAREDVNHRLKRALDPKGILAPGKSGIW